MLFSGKEVCRGKVLICDNLGGCRAHLGEILVESVCLSGGVHPQKGVKSSPVSALI